MRSRVALLMLLFTAGLFTLPLTTHASGIPFFGPIIPSDVAGNNLCPAGWGMLIIVINNIIELAITLVIVFIAPIMIAYSGFLFVVNPVNPGGREKAKGILLNTVVGTIVALAGWLIVDAVMAILYNPGAAGGTWSSIITSGGLPPCLPQAGSLYQLNQSTGANIQSISANGNTTLSFGTGVCDTNFIQQAAQAGGYSLTQGQADTFACIAKPESQCGTDNVLNYDWGKGSSAAGAFQVLLSTNSDCYNNSVCEQAAGATGPLNCASGFSNGNPISANNAIVSLCVKAAANQNCSTVAAACLFNQVHSFSPWTADPSSTAQAQCIATYANSP